VARPGLSESIRVLEEARAQHDAVLVSYSGGKDSLAVLDLCSRYFERVEAFFMYIVPGLRSIEEKLEYARQRYGVTIHQVPHWITIQMLKNGAFCWGDSRSSASKVGDWRLADVYRLVRKESGIELIAHGGRKADSLWRRRHMAESDYSNVIFPLKGWNKFDSASYLKARGLPNMSGTNKNANGIGLETTNMVWLRENYPDDLDRIDKVFPFARARLLRHDLYFKEAASEGES